MREHKRQEGTAGAMRRRWPRVALPVATAPLIWFFALSFGVAWSIWITIGLMVPDLEPARGTFLTVPGAWAPTIAAVLLTAWYEGRGGLRELLAQVGRWRIRWWWYAFAVLAPSAFGLLAIEIHVLTGGAAPSMVAMAAGLGMPAGEASHAIVAFPIVFLVLLLGGPIAEEPGWRGFAQPRLQALIGAGPAGLVIGLVWSVWHLPLVAFVPSGTGEMPAWFFLPFVVALGVIFAWGYNRTGGSVLFTILLHAGVNTFFAYRLVTASEDPNLLMIALLLAVVLGAFAFRQMGYGEVRVHSG